VNGARKGNGAANGHVRKDPKNGVFSRDALEIERRDGFHHSGWSLGRLQGDSWLLV